MKALIISPKNRTVYNFRGDLVKEIQNLGYEVVVTGPNHDNFEEIEKLGVRFQKVPLQKNRLNFLADLVYAWRLYKLMVREKPNLVLAYTIKPVIYGSIAARFAGLRNMNSMITGGGYLFTTNTLKTKILQRLGFVMLKMAGKWSKTVIFQNPDDMQEFVSRKLVKLSKARMVNGSGVNLKKFVPAPLPTRICFLMVSRMLANKGVREYLEAARLVKQKHPEVRFVLLGKFENHPGSLCHVELQQYFEKGFVEHHPEASDVSPYYRECSVYVLPSYREGTPRTVLEAMATGRPIITTNVPGCRQTVEDGVSGFLVEAKNIEQLAKKMEWFVNNNEKIEKMGRESLRLCKKKFDVKMVNNEMMAILNLNQVNLKHSKC